MVAQQPQKGRERLRSRSACEGARHLPKQTILWSGFLPLLLLPPLSAFPWAPPAADARRCLLGSASSSPHLTITRYTLLQGFLRYLVPAFFADAVDHSAVSTPSTKGASSVDPPSARNSLRSSTMQLCQILNCPPSLRFSPPAIVPNITRLGNRSLLYRATASAKKSRRLRMVVSMYSSWYSCHSVCQCFSLHHFLATLHAAYVDLFIL